MTHSHMPWTWTRRFAVGLTISVAAFSAWGALAPHIPMDDWAAPLAAGALMAAPSGSKAKQASSTRRMAAHHSEA